MKTLATLALAASAALAAAPLALADASPTATDFRPAYRRPATVPHPEDNPPTPGRVELGKMLFFDPRLSGTGAISCATCHNPSFAWTDRLPLGRGDSHKPLGRHTPTILNAAFNEVQMWDGRFATLEEQAIGPMMSTAEMNITAEEILARLNAIPRYVELFALHYGTASVTTDAVTKAIACFERTIISGEAPFDRFVAGDEQAISPAARRGFELFNTKGHCAACHSGWTFTDSSFHDIGVASDDLGRGPVLGLDALNHAFKTPTLRNVADHPPYMHNGSEATLRQVIELYNAGGRVQRPTLSSEIKPLGLDDREIDDLVAFLETLSSQDAPVTLPVLP